MSTSMQKNYFIADMYRAINEDMSGFAEYPKEAVDDYTYDTKYLAKEVNKVHFALNVVACDHPKEFQQHLIDNTVSVAINSVYTNLDDAFQGLKKAVDSGSNTESARKSMEKALTKRATAIEKARNAINEGREFLKPHYCSRNGGVDHCYFRKSCIRRARADGKICREDKAFDDAKCPRRDFCNGEFTEKQEEVLKKHNMSLCPCSYSHICIVRIRADDRVECFEDEVLDAHKITRRKNCMEPLNNEPSWLLWRGRQITARSGS